MAQKSADVYEYGFKIGQELIDAGADVRVIGNIVSALEDHDIHEFNYIMRSHHIMYYMPEDFDFDGETDNMWSGIEDGFGVDEDEDEDEDSEKSYRKDASSPHPMSEYDPDVEPAKMFPLNMAWVTDYFYDRKIVEKMLKYWGDVMTFDKRKGYVVNTTEQDVFEQYSMYMGDDKEILSWFVNTLEAAKASGYKYLFFVTKQ